MLPPIYFSLFGLTTQIVALVSTQDDPQPRAWNGKNASNVLRMLLDQRHYDKRFRPEFEGKPLQVLVTLYITSLGGLDEREMQFESTFFIRQMWYDPRLRFGQYYTKRNLTLNGNIMDQLWLPDTYVNNEKSHTAPKTEFLLTISPDGKVIYSQRMTVIAACKMDLRNYPMDKQNCSLLFESYGMTADDLFFKWDDTSNPGNLRAAVAVGEELIMSQFAVDNYTVDEITASYVTGTFSMLKITFHIRRKKFYYVVSIYIPTILITILSWVSFWIPRGSPPARVALGITTVLALTTLIFGIQASMPRVSYVKAIDWFLCVSFLYVFAALVEYPSSTFVKSQAKKLTRKGTSILRKVKGLKDDPEDSFPLSGTRYGSTDKSRDDDKDLRKLTRERNGERLKSFDHSLAESTMGRDSGHQNQRPVHFGQLSEDENGDFVSNFRDEGLNVVDQYSKIVFPLSYVLFNICYWIIYLAT
ncbi:glycine receptor subunit alphaZ1-like isoform X1 [Montipora foliosa]|uniref:glycine receptor subunit alphaZ1-like isoform X1 n=2 Tax=Montipora foliosa TaxID=591990 RepID=UPI0035F119CD